jgi:DNA-binding transcriptional ArsR family regulator
MDSSTLKGGRAELLTVRTLRQGAALLQPQRIRLLEGLREPDSAAGLARRLGLPRQLVNYHLRELERAGLVELVEERRRGNCTERMMVAAARRIVISPEVLGGLDAGGDEGRDPFAPSSLVAAAARSIRALGELPSPAAGVAGGTATMALESDVRFASIAARNAFARELSDAVAHLVVKYHEAGADEGLGFRIMVGAYPVRGRHGDAGTAGHGSGDERGA